MQTIFQWLIEIILIKKGILTMHLDETKQIDVDAALAYEARELEPFFSDPLLFWIDEEPLPEPDLEPEINEFSVPIPGDPDFDMEDIPVFEL